MVMLVIGKLRQSRAGKAWLLNLGVVVGVGPLRLVGALILVALGLGS